MVVDGKDVEDQKDPDATPERDLSNSNSKTQRLAKTSRKSDESASALRYFEGKYLVDCFTDLADLLNISEPHRNIFRSELQKQGSLQDRDGAALTLHSAIETAVKEVGEETSQQLLQLRDATGMRDLAELSLGLVRM